VFPCFGLEFSSRVPDPARRGRQAGEVVAKSLT
jgi:hypothetical protein